MNSKKVIIFSAPSGAGKTTIVNYLLENFPKLSFSISATSRPPRGKEQHGREYYFLTPENFRERIEAGHFVEYEEVYQDLHYGTLKEELERIWKEGKVALFDVDVKGGLNLKKEFGKSALSIFVMPPSIEVLQERLSKRGTESLESIEYRVKRAQEELEYASKFDRVLINDNLELALVEGSEIVSQFLNEK